MSDRLIASLSGARAWLLLGMLLSRAAGFLTSLLLARAAGASALGVYTTVMNTAAPLVAPVSHAMINTGTLMAADSCGTNLRALWRAQLALCAAAMAIALPLFAWLFDRAVGAGELQGGERAWALLGAAAVMISQLATPVVAALLHGEGRFREAGRCSVLAGAIGLAAVVPVVGYFGLAGALGLAAANALLACGLVSAELLRRHPGAGSGGAASLVRPLLSRLRAALPAVAGLGLNGAASWLCTVYLVNVHWGSSGMGVLGVGLQWSTLMLMPATSWGGMTLALLGDAWRSGNRATLKTALRAQLLRNGATTLAAGVVVMAAAGLLERLYRMEDSGLVVVLAAFALAAVVTSLNNVFERLWWAAGRQRAWFSWQCLALALQIGTTLWLLPMHLAYAGIGVLVAAITLSACSLLALRLDGTPMQEARP